MEILKVAMHTNLDDNAMKTDIFHFCNHCKVSDKCCKQLGPGFNLSAPIITEREIEQIRERIKMKSSPINNFIESQGKKLTVIVTNSCSGCVFHKNMRCKIYDIRPFDCKIFPLDVFKIGSQFCWVAYETFCEQEIDWNVLISYGESLLKQYDHIFLEDFALDIEQFPPTLAYTILKEVKNNKDRQHRRVIRNHLIRSCSQRKM
jgi:Fe-S-cluster containining protein